MPPGASSPPGSPEPAPPVFARTLRGYLPAQVDAHLGRLQRELLTAQAAAARAAEAAQSLQATSARQSQELTEARERLTAGEQEAAQLHQQLSEARQLAEARQLSEARQQVPEQPADPGQARHPGPAAGGPAAGPVYLGKARPEPRRTHPRLVAALGIALALLLIAGVGAVFLLRDDDDAAAPGASGAPASSTSAGPAAAAPLPVTGDPVVPEGWRSYSTTDGSTLAVPTDWKMEGIGTGIRYVSASGLSEVTLTSSPAVDVHDVEQAFAGSRSDYTRTSGADTTFRGRPAYIWDYTVGDGATSQQGSDLAVLGGGLGYHLHVQSRSSTWPSVEPLLAAIRGAFAPAV